MNAESLLRYLSPVDQCCWLITHPADQPQRALYAITHLDERADGMDGYWTACEDCAAYSRQAGNVRIRSLPATLADIGAAS